MVSAFFSCLPKGFIICNKYKLGLQQWTVSEPHEKDYTRHSINTAMKNSSVQSSELAFLLYTVRQDQRTEL